MEFDHRWMFEERVLCVVEGNVTNIGLKWKRDLSLFPRFDVTFIIRVILHFGSHFPNSIELAQDRGKILRLVLWEDSSASLLLGRDPMLISWICRSIWIDLEDLLVDNLKKIKILLYNRKKN